VPAVELRTMFADLGVQARRHATEGLTRHG
jgi:hypothetical protein